MWVFRAAIPLLARRRHSMMMSRRAVPRFADDGRRLGKMFVVSPPPLLLLLLLIASSFHRPASSVVLQDVNPAGSDVYEGCSEAELEPWLSPRHRLRGYHVLCVAPLSPGGSSDDREVVVFREGGFLPEYEYTHKRGGRGGGHEGYVDEEDDEETRAAMRELVQARALVLRVAAGSSFEAFRDEVGSDLGVGHHVDPWHDAGKFFQLCRNENTDGRCQEWATRGECDANPDYMMYSCAGSCGSCNLTVDQPVWRPQPWRLFHANNGGGVGGGGGGGTQDVVEGLAELDRGGLFLLFEGGQFIWPGIRIGFERKVTLAAPSRRGSSSSGGGGGGGGGGERREVVVRTLALQPLVVEIDDFLSDEECDHVIAEATPHMAKSKVALMDKDKGKKDAEFRTSSTYFMPSQTRSLQEIDDRVASLTRVPRQHQEYVQVLRYDGGQYYGSHHDYWDPDFYQSDEWLSMSQGGFSNRLATVFWYMTDVAAGGETNFPRAHGGPDLPNTNANCGRRGLSVAPTKGKVIIFYSLRPDGSGDTFSLHSACPVREGIKWAANKWVWNQNKGFIR